MPVIRATKDKDFTVMSIHHLRDTRLSLKAIGLFSIVLSLPPEWKFSVVGLAAITKDGITSVRGALNELEQNGYLTRKRLRSQEGRLEDSEYTFFELPEAGSPNPEKPEQEKPDLEVPALENPILGWLREYNIERSNID